MKDNLIHAIGMKLEGMGCTDAQIDEYFEHHGVKGMKWGFRKSKKTTGVSRPRGALIDINKRQINNIALAKSGEKYQFSVALGRKLVGAETQKRNWKTMTSNLKAQNKRLKSGKLVVGDRLDMWGKVSLASLYVSRTPAA